MFNSDDDYAQRNTAAGALARAREMARNPQPAPPPYMAPEQPPCDFRAARAMLYLIDLGLDPGWQPYGLVRSAMSWQVRAAFETLARVRLALLPDGDRSRCAVNVSAEWEVVA